MVRYEISYCCDNHDDYQYQYRTTKVKALSLATAIVPETFHGAVMVVKQESEIYTDERVPYVEWENTDRWEVTQDGIEIL